MKEQQEATQQCDHVHIAESVIVVNPPTPIASQLAPLPAPPAPLPVVMTINDNGRIISTPAFIPKAIPAAIPAKPIPHRYTGSMKTRPSIWVNAKKARDLADHMDVTLTVLTLKHFESHVSDIIHPPQNHSLKWQIPSPNFIFTEDDFPYLPGSGTPSKRQYIDDRTISVGSPMLPPDIAGDFDTDYFASVLNFLDHEPDANYIEQSLVWQCNLTSPEYFGLNKNIFYRSVPVSLYGLVASTHPTGCNTILLINVHARDISNLSHNGFWTLVLQCTLQANDLT